MYNGSVLRGMRRSQCLGGLCKLRGASNRCNHINVVFAHLGSVATGFECIEQMQPHEMLVVPLEALVATGIKCIEQMQRIWHDRRIISLCSSEF